MDTSSDGSFSTTPSELWMWFESAPSRRVICISRGFTRRAETACCWDTYFRGSCRSRDMARLLRRAIVRESVQPSGRRSCAAAPPAKAVFGKTHSQRLVADLPAAAVIQARLQPAHRRSRVTGLLAARIFRFLFYPAHRRSRVSKLPATGICW